MPAYNTQSPPFAIQTGEIAYSFGSWPPNNAAESLETIPTSAQAGQQISIFAPANFAGSGRAVTWRTQYDAAPSAIAIALQGAMVDVDSQYVTVDQSANTAGETRTVSGVNVRFLRVKVISITVGGASKILAAIEV